MPLGEGKEVLVVPDALVREIADKVSPPVLSGCSYNPLSHSGLGLTSSLISSLTSDSTREGPRVDQLF